MSGIKDREKPSFFLGVTDIELACSQAGCDSVRAVDTGTRAFWGLVAVLLAAAMFFGFGAESRRRQVQRSEVGLTTGDITQLSRVVDGDTLLVEKDGSRVAVRILGIKSFDSSNDKDVTSQFGKLAQSRLARLMEDAPIRVLVNQVPTDKHGRTLAELYVNDTNVGLELVKAGLSLVYTVYPFPSMSLYLDAQAAARAERRGLWGNPDVAKRAELLANEWRRRAE